MTPPLSLLPLTPMLSLYEEADRMINVADHLMYHSATARNKIAGVKSD